MSANECCFDLCTLYIYTKTILMQISIVVKYFSALKLVKPVNQLRYLPPVLVRRLNVMPASKAPYQVVRGTRIHDLVQLPRRN